jgi:hypothetical protein
MEKDMRRLLLGVGTLAMVMSTPATAVQTPKSYFCKVKNTYGLSDAGEIKPLSDQSAWTGERFQINIKTGEMIGTSPFSSSQWARISVLDSGTSQQGSFLKVMYSSEPNGDFVNDAYLTIQGRIEQSSRPFLYTFGPWLYSGVCSAAFQMAIRAR